MSGKIAAALLCLLCSLPAHAGAEQPATVSALPPSELSARIADDARQVHRLRERLRATVGFARSRPDLFPPAASALRMPGRQAREEIVGAWKSMLDATLALDSLGRFYESFHRLEGSARAQAFAVERAAFLARYRFALEFIGLAETNPALAPILNDPVPDLGLAEDSYARYKFMFLNVAAAARCGVLASVAKALPADPSPAPLDDGIAEDEARILAIGAWDGQLLTAKNVLAVVADGGYAAWFPVQAGVSEWMGDTKVKRRHTDLVTHEQIRSLQPALRPGDILLERREWYLSNVGLPGFWPHAALYVGTPAERRSFFGGPQVQAWVRARGGADGDLEKLLERRHPAAYALAVRAQEAGHAPRVLEAMSEGVVFTTIEHSASCDSLAVLRPRLQPVEIAEALLRAFGYSGRPYDFDFDFLTDDALVCTELVYKAYEPSPGYRGLRFALGTVLGRPVVPANGIARQFDQEYGTDAQQTDLLLFLDGQEREGRAVEAPLEEFRRSVLRPKWHVVTQAAGPPR
ncbi:MAG TPA: YiiX/YebB-like N1pC/P60 family cysteine hydrolase [bacterium]